MGVCLVIYGILILIIMYDLEQLEEKTNMIFNNEKEILRILKEQNVIKEVEDNGEKR